MVSLHQILLEIVIILSLRTWDDDVSLMFAIKEVLLLDPVTRRDPEIYARFHISAVAYIELYHLPNIHLTSLS